jgi:hypothetical protein
MPAPPRLEVPSFAVPHLSGRHVPLPHLAADLESLARRADRIADEVRRTEERLRRQARAVRWESSAATAYQERALAHAVGLARCACLVDEVAEDLRHSALVVHERAVAVQRAAAAAGHALSGLLEELR